MIDILQNADKQTGILYYSWILLHTQGNKEVLSSDTYRMISSYTDLPVFTLNDMDIVENGMAGDFSSLRRIFPIPLLTRLTDF